jgi:hypothetical protein
MAVTAGRHTLVIHPGALGDVLQAVPALRALRREGPVVFAGQPRLGALLRGMGLVDTALSFDGFGLEALFTAETAPPSLVARLAGFHRVISWFGARDKVYARQLGAIARASVIATPVGDDRIPVWRHLLATIGASSADLARCLPADSWRDQARRMLRELGAEPERPLLVAHPGAGGRWKRWPAETAARVIADLGRSADVQVSIHQGPADGEVVDDLYRRLDARALRLVEPDLSLLAGILDLAAAYIGGDSGVSHLAAAVGAPAVILFPPSTRERWAPWSPTARTLALDDDAGRIVEAVRERLRVGRRGPD